MDTETTELDDFRHAQRVAYDAVEAVAGRLRPGDSERKACRMLRRELRERGVREWFHVPFAWFGDRTTFPRPWLPLRFFPTGAPLREGDPAILDVAPVIDGTPVDIGYSFRVGDNALHERMLMDLGGYRDLILDLVRKERTMREIYQEVDAKAVADGYRNRHRAYPYRVLAHKVGWQPTPVDARAVVAGFGLPAVRYIRGEANTAKNSLTHGMPLWNETRSSAEPASPGLWAIEPHLACRGVGVKFEEILAVTESDAYWLDEDLPHVRHWVEAKEAA